MSSQKAGADSPGSRGENANSSGQNTAQRTIDTLLAPVGHLEAPKSAGAAPLQPVSDAVVEGRASTGGIPSSKAASGPSTGGLKLGAFGRHGSAELFGSGRHVHSAHHHHDPLAVSASQTPHTGSLLTAAVDARDRVRSSRRHVGTIPRTTKHGEKLVLFPIDDSVINTSRGGLAGADDAWKHSGPRSAGAKELRDYGFPWLGNRSGSTTGSSVAGNAHSQGSNAAHGGVGGSASSGTSGPSTSFTMGAHGRGNQKANRSLSLSSETQKQRQYQKKQNDLHAAAILSAAAEEREDVLARAKDLQSLEGNGDADNLQEVPIRESISLVGSTKDHFDSNLIGTDSEEGSEDDDDDDDDDDEGKYELEQVKRQQLDGGGENIYQQRSTNLGERNNRRRHSKSNLPPTERERRNKERTQKRRQEEAQMIQLLQTNIQPDVPEDGRISPWKEQMEGDINNNDIGMEKDGSNNSSRKAKKISFATDVKDDYYQEEGYDIKRSVGLTPWLSETNEVVVPDVIPTSAATEAEKLPKSHRDHLPKVTSYCIGDTIRIKDVYRLLANIHSVGARIFDECLYVVYDGEDKERYFGPNQPERRQAQYDVDSLLNDNEYVDEYEQDYGLQYVAKLLNPELPKQTENTSDGSDPSSLNPSSVVGNEEELTSAQKLDYYLEEDLEWMSRGEVFIFDYGVVVLWNFTDEQEIAFFNLLSNYVVKPLNKDKIQMEIFHYQYDLYGPALPRIFNDMITLKSGSLLIKLTISHALAQSVKLTLYENEMEETIEYTIPLPRTMAKTGEFNLVRTEVMKIVGRLFQLKMGVNLVSNVLDTPEIFWLEPELDGLYAAMRSYMEISQRTTLLNSRADVINDLLDMLTDHLDHDNMDYITLIIIWLIIIAVIVALVEVGVKLLLVEGH